MKFTFFKKLKSDISLNLKGVFDALRIEGRAGAGKAYHFKDTTPPPFPFKSPPAGYIIPEYLWSATADVDYDFEYATFLIFSKHTRQLHWIVNTADHELSEDQVNTAWAWLWEYHTSDHYCVLQQIDKSVALFKINNEGKPALVLKSVHEHHNHFENKR